MKQEELVRTLARETHQSASAARDQLDWVVHDIVTRLRRGELVELPGIGRLTLRGLIQARAQGMGKAK